MKLRVLGSGQDAGVPQIGCYCKNCQLARRYKKHRRFGPSIALINNNKSILIDASPDLKYQYDMIIDDTPIDAIFLTHTHLGHCHGLWLLGKESMDIKNMKVFSTASVKHVISKAYPLLLQNKNIQISTILPNRSTSINGFKFTPIEVPHRNEIADTVGYIIDSRIRTMYLSDLDHWTDEIIETIVSCDLALIDGSFYSKNEIPRYDQVMHPPVMESLKVLKDLDTTVYFTHLNHTNPLNRPGKERELIKKHGFKIAYDGMTLKI
jgi:pyrroloquinoline quinone biosynthesis protein B